MKKYNVIVGFLRGLMKVFFPTVVIGKENIPNDGALIVCANHQAALDVLFLAYPIKRQIHFMAKKELFNVFMLKSLLKAVDAFSIDRGSADITAVKTALRYLKNGEALGIFPQGTRVSGSESIDAKNGVAMFAAKSKCSVLPMYIHYPKKKPKLFRKTYVVIGESMGYESLGFVSGGKDEYEAVANNISNAISNLACQL